MFYSYLIYQLTFGTIVSLYFRFFYRYTDFKIDDNFFSSVTFIVAVHNEEDYILDFLHSLDSRVNLLVIDNFSTDRTVQIIRNTFPSAHIVQIANHGTHTPDIRRKIFSNVQTPWSLFLGVREYVPNRLLFFASKYLTQFDAIYLPRISFTCSYPTHLSFSSLKIFFYSFFTSNTLDFRLLKNNSWDYSRSSIHHELPILPSARYKILLWPFVFSFIYHLRPCSLSSDLEKISRYLNFENPQLSFLSFFRYLFSPLIFLLLSILASLLTLSFNIKSFSFNILHSYYRFLVFLKLFK